MNKWQQVRAALAAAGADALWVTGAANVEYLSGFTHPEDGRVLVTPGAVTLFTDGRYTVQAAEDALPGVEVIITRQHAKEAAPLLDGLRVAVEAEHLSVAAFEALKKEWPAEPQPLSGVVEGLRLVKTPGEIAKVRAAQNLADRIWAEVRPQIAVGVREVDIALLLEQELRRAGASSAFDIIVASGVRGALPHGAASSKVIEDGDLVTVDFGARLEGYNSDMTRTVAVGTPAEELRRVYEAVREAEAAAVQAIRPGLRTSKLDGVARDILNRHGLGEAFSHSLGHGVGLEVHEGPSLSARSEDVLQPGMVITIEPGAYLPELGGVRIEDLVLVTESGYEVLSRSPIDAL